MTLDELKRLLDGPVAAYLSGECTYGRFVELLREEFPELECSYADIYPRLFNLEVQRSEKNKCAYLWDVWTVGREYLKNKSTEELKTIFGDMGPLSMGELAQKLDKASKGIKKTLNKMMDQMTPKEKKLLETRFKAHKELVSPKAVKLVEYDTKSGWFYAVWNEKKKNRRRIAITKPEARNLHEAGVPFEVIALKKLIGEK